MGSIDGRLARLEREAKMGGATRPVDERLERKDAITTMILDEFARLKASRAVGYRGGKRVDPEDTPGRILGPGYTTGQLWELAIRRVVAEQYDDLPADSQESIAEGWTQNMREWSRLDWLAPAGQEPTNWTKVEDRAG